MRRTGGRQSRRDRYIQPGLGHGCDRRGEDRRHRGRHYLTSLGRAPTAAEIGFYVGVAKQGLTQSQIAAHPMLPYQLF